MNRTILLTPALLLLLTACTTGGSGGAADPGAGSDANSSSSSSSAKPSKDGGSGETKIGQTFTYDDGLKVTVTDKGAFKPSDTASVGEKKTKSYEVFQITIVNGTKKTFDPNLTSVTLQDGEAEAEPVADTNGSIGIQPTTKVLAGRTVKWKVGFGVDTKDWVVQVTPDFDHDAAVFSGK